MQSSKPAMGGPKTCFRWYRRARVNAILLPGGIGLAESPTGWKSNGSAARRSRNQTRFVGAGLALPLARWQSTTKGTASRPLHRAQNVCQKRQGFKVLQCRVTLLPKHCTKLGYEFGGSACSYPAVATPTPWPRPTGAGADETLRNVATKAQATASRRAGRRASLTVAAHVSGVA